MKLQKYYMYKQRGIATIPLIFGLLLIMAIPLTLNQVKQNQNLQNQAAYSGCLSLGQSNCFVISCCPGLKCQNGTCKNPTQNNQIPCHELKTLYLSSCSQSRPTKNKDIPCSEIKQILDQSCN